MKPIHCKFDELPLKEIAPGFTRRHISGNSTTFAYLELKKGSIVPEHHHPNEQITYIPKGLCIVTTPFGKYTLAAGDALVLPSGTPHHFEALEDTIDFDIFSPPRFDFDGSGTPWNPAPPRSLHEAGTDEVRRRYSPEAMKMLESLQEFSPGMGKIVLDYAHGELWQRPVLSPREKEMVALSSLISQDAQMEVRLHFHSALNRGLTADELKEIIVLLTAYVGIPRALNAMLILKEELAKRAKEQ